MEILVRPMKADEYEAVSELWSATEGVFLADADTADGLASYLDRNPTTSFVALMNGRVVGAVLCGHDGRRASMHHLAVATQYRGRGIGRRLVSECINALAAEGISTSFIFVLQTNTEAIAFWQRLGWDIEVDFAAFKYRH